MIREELSHPWNLSPTEAVALQKELAAQVIQEVKLGLVTTVAGIDASYRDGLARAAVAVLSYPDLEMIDSVVATRPTSFPYEYGLLSFREGPGLSPAGDNALDASAGGYSMSLG